MNLLLLFSGVAFFLNAQSTGKHFEKNELPAKSWIFKKDNTYLNAVVLKDNGEFLNIIDGKGKALRLSYDEIERFKREKGLVSPVSKGRFHYDSGLFAHYFASINISGQAFTGVSQFVLGHKFKKSRFSMGLGLGFDSYHDTFGDVIDQDFIFTSLSLYTRYDLTDFRARLYLYNRLGWGIGLDNIDNVNFEIESDDRYSGGWNVSPGIGVSFASKRRFRFIMELGMVSQWTEGNYVEIDPFTNREFIGFYDNVLIRPTLKIGLEYQ